MALREQLSNLKTVQALIPAVYNADQAVVSDLEGFDSALVQFNIGNSADTLSGSVYMNLELDESDDNVTYNAVPKEKILVRGGTENVNPATDGVAAVIDAPAEDSTCVEAAYLGSKRYIKSRINFVGTHTTGTPCSINVVKGDARAMPVL